MYCESKYDKNDTTVSLIHKYPNNIKYLKNKYKNTIDSIPNNLKYFDTNCIHSTKILPNSLKTLCLREQDIKQQITFPKFLKSLYIQYCGVSPTHSDKIENNIYMLPKTLTSLKLGLSYQLKGKLFNTNIINYGLKYLSLNGFYIEENKFPDSITHIELIECEFIDQISILPNNLKFLHFECDEIYLCFDQLPHTLEYLCFIKSTINDFFFFPQNLKSLTIRFPFPHTGNINNFINFPHNLEYISIHNSYFDSPLNNLPKSLKKIHITNSSYSYNIDNGNPNLLISLN